MWNVSTVSICMVFVETICLFYYCILYDCLNIYRLSISVDTFFATIKVYSLIQNYFRNFTEHTLAQIKWVFPDAYSYAQKKCTTFTSSVKKDKYELTLIPHFDKSPGKFFYIVGWFMYINNFFTLYTLCNRCFSCFCFRKVHYDSFNFVGETENISQKSAGNSKKLSWSKLY